MKAESSTRKSPVRAAAVGINRVSSRAQPAVAPVPVIDEDDTLRTCLQGIHGADQPALARFYDQTVGRVYGVALRIVRRPDLAEDVVADVYLQVWRGASGYDAARGKVLGWLLVIARSRALDLLRRQDEAFSHPEPWDLVKERESSRHDPQDLLEAAQAGSAVQTAMLKLNPVQRQLLSLAFFRGLSHSEIVAHSGIPLGTVKTHIRRALAVLRESLAANAAGALREKHNG